MAQVTQSFSPLGPNPKQMKSCALFDMHEQAGVFCFWDGYILALGRALFAAIGCIKLQQAIL
jgi:hypothetical protein